MATVYRAFDQRLQVWRAIKVLLPEFARKKKLIARFESEAQTMALLEHPHIVRVYDVDREGDVAFIVMEIIEGGSLVDWQERHGPMPPRLAVDIMVEVCQAIGFAHERGVIHRDIKPHNVLIDRKGVCRVTDFGIARAGDDNQGLTKTGAVMGTWGYMAPEQRTDAKHVDARADVYALAATLYALVTARAPMDLFAADRDGTIMDGVDPALIPVLRRGTEYRKEARYGSAEELAAALVAVREHLAPDPAGTPPLAPDVSASTPTPPPTTLGGARDTILPPDPPARPDAAPAPPPQAPAVSMPTVSIDDDEAPPQPVRAGGVAPYVAGIGLVALLGVGWWSTRPVEVAAAPDPREVPALTAPVDVRPAEVVPAAPAPPAPEVQAAPPKPADPRPPRPADAQRPIEPPPKRIEADPPPQPPPQVKVDEPPPAQCLKVVSVKEPLKVGGSAAFRATTCRDGDVTLHYRAHGAADYYRKKMVLRVGAYSALVNVDEAFKDGIEWFVVAEGASDGSAGKPHRTKVSP